MSPGIQQTWLTETTIPPILVDGMVGMDEMDGMDGMDVMDGMDGIDNMDGMDGMDCLYPADRLPT